MPTRTARWLLSFLFVAAAACGSDNNTIAPCDTAAAPESCGQTCTLDTECGSGLHCGVDGACTAECAVGSNDCGEGAVCTTTGRCQAGGGGSGGDDECPRIAVAVGEVIPTVQLLIDQSGSMTARFGDGLDRWQAVRQALVDQTSGVVTTLGDKVRFGATLYSSINGNAGTCPLLVEAAPALNNREAIRTLLLDNDPQEDTPTAESVTAVANKMQPLDPQKPEPLIIVLATDGDPDTCVDPDAHNLESQRLSEMAVQGAYTKGIKTFVLSVGNEVSEPHLKRLANAGRGLPLDTGNAPFYVANSPAQLADAFRQIIGIARSCTFELEGRVTDPNDGLVELNGMPLEYGTDWTLPNESTIELVGAACESYLNLPNATLNAEFACGTVIL